MSLGVVVHARLDGAYVYYQLAWNYGTLTCKYKHDNDDWVDFPDSTYNQTYAECSKWGRGNSDYDISLTLNEITYYTDENTAISNGPITSKYC